LDSKPFDALGAGRSAFPSPALFRGTPIGRAWGHQRPGGAESTRTRTISRTLNPNDGTGPVFSRAVGSRGRGVTAHTRAPKTGHPGW